MKTAIWIELALTGPAWRQELTTGKTFKRKPTGQQIPASSRVVKVELDVPKGLFENLVIGVAVPEPDLSAAGTVDFS